MAYYISQIENLAVTPSATGATATWTYGPPATGDGGSYSLRHFAVFYQLSGPVITSPDFSGVFPPATADGATSQVFAGLTTGQPYGLSIAEYDQMSDTDPYELYIAYPSSTPTNFTIVPGYTSAPTSVSVTAASGSSVTVSWAAPAYVNYGYTVASYSYRYRAAGGSWSAPATGTSGMTVGGLSSGTTYEFEITPVMSNGVSSLGVGTGSGSPLSVTAPSEPKNVLLTAGDTQVVVDFDAPDNNGGAAIVDYTVEYSLNQSTWTTFSDGANSTTLSRTVTGLVNGNTYYFRVKATNALGYISSPSIGSTPANAKPAGLPSAPTLLTFVAGNSTVTVTITGGSGNGNSIIDRKVSYSDDDGATWTDFVDVVSSSLSIVVTGLDSSKSYKFRAKNITVVGESAWSSAFGPVSPTGLPGTPTGLVAVIDKIDAGSATIRLDWNEPALNGNLTLGSYSIQRSEDSGATWVAYSSSIWLPSYFVTVPTATPTVTHTFRVAAINGNGTGPYSTTASVAVVTPSGVAPDVPASITVAPGDKKLTVSWSTPASAGASGDVVLSYKIRYSSDDGLTWTEITKQA
jgi:hypothetical protein